MKKTSTKVINTTRVLASLLSFIIAIILPLGYFILAYEYQTAVLRTEAEAEATFASRLISADPDYWRFEQHRLEEFLSHRPVSGEREIRLIRDVGNAVVAQNADPVDGPFLTRSRDLYDSGMIVARIEISRSLRPLLVRTALLLAAGLLLGAGMFTVLRTFPLRALAQALQSLQQSEGKFRAIASTAADAIVVMDHHGAITYWNPAAEKIFGYSEQEALGRELHVLIAPENYRSAFRKGFEKFRQTGRGPAVDSTLEFTAVRKDGTEFPIEVSTSTIAMPDGWHAVGIVRNITERKKTEQELLKLEKLESLGVLAGGLAHDFNNLLTIILGNISLTLLDTDPTKDNFKRLTDVERAIVSAQDLTRQLLTFAKGGAPVKRTASIREIVEESCGFSLSGSNVKCSFSFAADLMPVEVDAGQIGQVINNLVINAAQAMPQGGTIEVRSENVIVVSQDGLPVGPGAYIRVSVHDQGVGISKENLSKIFDPYFTTKQRGSGLGLATSYSIVKRHGGCISVESVPGAGSVFHIYLPSSHQPVAAVEMREKPVPGIGRLLVMDDEEAVRIVAGQMLKTLGYSCEAAADGVEAVERYKRARDAGQPFDAVILDLTVIGGMGGAEAVKKLVEIDPKVKAIVASGYSNDPVLADYEAFGFAGVIAKPYSLQTLSWTIHSVLA